MDKVRFYDCEEFIASHSLNCWLMLVAEVGLENFAKSLFQIIAVDLLIDFVSVLS